MKIVVTGATGFIGSHVVLHLLNLNLNVFVTSSSPIKTKDKQWLSQVNYIPFSIGNEMNDVEIAFFQQADIVIHLAWQGLPDFKTDKHIHEFLDAQLKFIHQLSQLKIRRLVNIGTCLEYGLQEGELKETMEVFPVVNYAIAKNKLREYCDHISNTFENGTSWIRLFYIYGEGQSKKSFLPQLEQAIKENKAIFDMSDGEQERDYLPVEKVSEYIVSIALNLNAQGIVNCSSGKPIKIRTLAEEFIKKQNASIQLNLGAFPYPDYEPVRFWGNNDLMKSILRLK